MEPTVEDLARLVGPGPPADLRVTVQGRVTFLGHSSVLGQVLGPGQDLRVDTVFPDVMRAFLCLLYQPTSAHLAGLGPAGLLDLAHLAGRSGAPELVGLVTSWVQALPLGPPHLAAACRALHSPYSAAWAALHARLARYIASSLRSPEELSHQVLRHLGPDGDLTIPLQALLSTSGKMVTFNEQDEEMVFRGDSAILANTAKNRKKAEKKRLRAERRASLSDSGSMEHQADVQLVPARLHQLRIESQDDSGFASSFDDTLEVESFAAMGPGENGPTTDDEVAFYMASEMFKIDM